MTFSARFVLSLIDFAAQLGADMVSLIERSGLDVAAIQKEDQRLGPAVYNQVVEDAVSQTGDALMGLHFGESMQLSAAGLIGQITQNAPTIREAFQYSCEFAMLGCRALPMSLEEISPKQYRLTLEPDPKWAAQSAEAARHTTEGVLVFTLRQFEMLAGRDKPTKPHRVEFGYLVEKAAQAEYERILKSPVKFNAQTTAMYFDHAVMERKIQASDYDLLRVLVAYATEKVASLKEVAPFTKTVEKAVLSLADPSYPSVQEVASHLNQSVRSLQRRLADEGATFKALTDGLRREFALSYLARMELSIAEISYLLGYAESSAFVRSFKRWEGISPLKYRQGI